MNEVEALQKQLTVALGEITMLRFDAEQARAHYDSAAARVEKLEAALRWISGNGNYTARKIADAALGDRNGTND